MGLYKKENFKNDSYQAPKKVTGLNWELYQQDLLRPKTDEWKKGDKITLKNCKYGTGCMEIVSSRELFKDVRKKLNNSEKEDESIMQFGKYKGEKIEWVSKNHKHYFSWCLENVNGFKDLADKFAKENDCF